LLANIIARHQPGDVVTLHILRDSKPMTMRVTLGSD
jgi:S1-C subfamily serine protease